MAKDVKKVRLREWKESYSEKGYHSSLSNYVNLSKRVVACLYAGSSQDRTRISLSLSLLSKDLKAASPRPRCTGMVSRELHLEIRHALSLVHDSRSCFQLEGQELTLDLGSSSLYSVVLDHSIYNFQD